MSMAMGGQLAERQQALNDMAKQEVRS